MATARRWHWGEPTAPLARTLARGGVVAIPTESSYGLAADPRSTPGVAAIYALKGRGAHKPLPVVIAGPGQLTELGVDPGAPGLAELARHWPAPLSMVVAIDWASPAAAGGATLAVRVPAHERLRRLIAELGPLTATSANTAGEPPILEPGSLEPLFARAAELECAIVDDGRLPGGAPSTLVEWHDGGFRVLRAGAFDPQNLGDAPTVGTFRGTMNT